MRCTGRRPGAWTETIAVATTAGAAPELREPAAGLDRITVTWEAPASDATISGYELQWRSSGATEWTVETGIASSATSHTITGLQPQTTYEVQVRAVYGTTVGAWTETIAVATTAGAAPELREPRAGLDRITVTWEAPASDATISGYELQWRSSGATEWTVETGIASSATSHTITGLQPRTSYEVQVRAVYGMTAGTWTEAIAVSTTAPPPAPPPASDRPTLSLNTVSSNTVTVRWVAPATGRSITGYELQVRGGSISEWKRFTGIPSTDSGHTIEGLQPGTTYQVQVRAMFDGVAGSWSAILTCITLPLPLVQFWCPCQFTISEGAAAARAGFHAHRAAAFHFTRETFPTTIKYQVSETGDMLNSVSKGAFETPSGSFLGGHSYDYPLIRLPIVDDNVDEPDSTITVQILADPRYRVGYASSSKTTITDDDDPPSLDVDDVTVTEGDNGTVSATFTVSLSTASGWTVTVDWATSDGTATAGSDYTAGSGTLTFAAGTTEQTFDVVVTGDTVDEADETYTVTLSNASKASISDATGTGTITDDD